MQEIKKIIAKILEKELKKNDFSSQQIIELLENPPSKDLGDLAFPTFKLASIFKKNPKDIALELVGKIKLEKGIKEAKAIGPYVNFFIDENFLAQNPLKKALKEKIGYNNTNKGKKIVIEYSQPNTNKPLHVGHLRNNSLGMSVSRLLEMTGGKITKVDLFNDRGIHICQSMLAYKKWGNNSTPEKENLKSDHFVGKFYVMYHQKEKEQPELKEELTQMLQNWENGDKETLLLWKKMNVWAEKGFMQTYKDFGSEFDERFKESEIYLQAKPIIELGVKQKVFEKDEHGAIICDLEKWNLGKKTILRADGTSIYITQDLALGVQKNKKFKPNKSIYVVASEQNTYFQQLFKVIELLGFPWHNTLYHLSYGLVNLPEGKLKSREGKVIDADTLMKSMQDLAKEEIMKRNKDLPAKEIEKRAKEISLCAIKFFMLKTDPIKDMLFNPNEAISFEGDSGPYVQYTYARAKSILRKAKKSKQSKAKEQLTEEEKQVLAKISLFEEKIIEAAESYSPSKIANYLLELCGLFNSFYHKHKVIDEHNEYFKTRLEIVQATANIIKNGLYALNINSLEEM